MTAGTEQHPARARDGIAREGRQDMAEVAQL
jgi:hypothetical protein